MKLATSIEISVSEFWEMTPKELVIYAEAYRQRREARRDEQITLAYVNAMWTRQWFGEKHQQPEPLDAILKKAKNEQPIVKEMTDEMMLAKIKAINMAFGGTVRYVEKGALAN